MRSRMETRVGAPEAARASAEESLALFRRLGDAWGVAMASFGLATAEVEAGEDDAARAHFAMALEGFRRADDTYWAMSSLSMLARRAAMDGDTARAEALATEGLALSRRMGIESGPLLHSMAWARLRAGDAAEAGRYQADQLRLEWGRDYGPGLVAGLRLAARLAQASGRLAEAARFEGAADAVHEQRELPSPHRWLAQEHERERAELRGALGEDAFAAAYAEGRAHSHDAAVALALEQTQPNDA